MALLLVSREHKIPECWLIKTKDRRMKLRKLTSALIAAGALSSPFALGLGLGEIKLKSALNQPLEAEIKLLQTRELAKEEILASMAGDAEFDQAGVEKFFFLNDIDFDVSLTNSGDGTLLLTTKKSIQEPFLNFLVEVNWPNGRALREYTLLLDPPVYEEDLQPITVTPQASSQPASAQVQQVAQKNSSATAPATQVTPASSNSRVSNGTFGPVKSTDTMWDIAVAVRPDRSASVQQTMMAIRELNPSAFVAGNINKLKKGAVLRIPSSEDAQRLSHQEAVNEVAAHNERYRRSLLPPEPVEQTPQLSAVDKPVVQNTMAPEEARLEIVRPNESSAADGQMAGVSGSGEESGDSIEIIQNELAITQENLDKANRENEKLATRLDALEKQLQAVTKLMTLKDNQMAELQAGVGQTSSEESALVESPEGSVAPEESAVVEELSTSEVMPADEVAETEASQVIADSGEQVSSSDEMAMNEAPSEPVVEEAAPTPKPVPKPTIVPETQSQAPVEQKSTGIVDQIMNNPIWQAAIGLGALLFVALLFVMSRRSYLRESELTDAIEATPKDTANDTAASPEQEMDAIDKELDNLDIEEPGFGQVALDEDSDDILQPDNVLARADSFIAYGQFDNAVHLVGDAINSEPNRVDLRLKMLEIYAEMQDSQGFEKQKKEIMDLGGDDVSDQIRVLEQKLPGGLGSSSVDAFDQQDSVDFGEPLMSEEDLASSGSSQSGDDLSYSLEDLESELASDLSGEPLSTAGDSDTDALDFDLDAELGEPSELEKAEEAADEFDFDLSSEEGDALDADSMDISIDLDESSSTAGSEELTDLDTDDFSLDVSEEVSLDEAADASEPSSEMEFDLDVDLDGSSEEGRDLDLVSDIDVSEEIETDIELDDVEESDADMPAVEDNMLGSAESEVDLSSDIEDLSKSLGVDSLDDVDLDAELASASESEATVQGDDPLLAEGDSTEDALDIAEESISEDALEVVDQDIDGSGSQEPELELDDLEASDLDLDSELSQVESAGDELSLEVDGDLSLDAPVDEDLSLDADAPADSEVAQSPEADASAAELEEDELDFYVGSDEVATKLDLARAYVDMGDLDGARDILEEVVLEGNPDQKTEANELLNSL
jgi:pilus assembly protein FimV